MRIITQLAAEFQIQFFEQRNSVEYLLHLCIQVFFCVEPYFSDYLTILSFEAISARYFPCGYVDIYNGLRLWSTVHKNHLIISKTMKNSFRKAHAKSFFVSRTRFH